MRIYYINRGNEHYFTNGLKGDKRIDYSDFTNCDTAFAFVHFRTRYNLWDLENDKIIEMNKVMKNNTYYLMENGNILHRSGAYNRLLKYTADTKDATIWYNNHIVWAQNPENYEEG